MNLTGIIIGFFTFLWLFVSSNRFLKGIVKKFLDKIMAGVLFLYFSVVSSFIIELYSLYETPVEIPRYLFLIIGFLFLYWASLDINEISKVLGFKSEAVPKKLKKILK